MTERMAWATHRAVRTYLRAQRDRLRLLPNPSDEAKELLDEMSEVQHVLRNIEGLQDEKGWR